MKRKALDQQLEMMVGHADKLSEMVQEGLIGERSSRTSSLRSGDVVIGLHSHILSYGFYVQKYFAFSVLHEVQILEKHGFFFLCLLVA